MSTEQAIISQQMETPKGSHGAFELPCGHLDLETNVLTRDIEIREMTGNEEDMLASPSIPSSRKVTMLLAGCLTRLGPVTDKGKLAQMVDDLPMGDRMYLLFAIRRTTLGDEMPVREACPECKVKSLFMLDLSDMTVKQMPDPMKRIYDVSLPSGTTARFRVSTGKEEHKMAKVMKKERTDSLSQALMMRLEMLNDEPPTLAAVKSLSLRDRLALRDKFQEVEGGIDTAMDFECPACGHEWSEDLDIGNRNFFFPSETRKA